MSYPLLQAELKPEGVKPVQLRKRNLIPAVLYGEHENSIPICIQERIVLKTLNATAKIFEVQINNNSEKYLANIDKVQRDPITRKPIHLYFRRMSANVKAKLTVPIILQNRAAGEVQGGVTIHQLSTVDIMAFPKDLPESIVLDISNLQVEHGLHVSDLPLPPGVQLADLNDAKLMVVTCYIQKAEAETVATPVTDVDGAATTATTEASTDSEEKSE